MLRNIRNLRRYRQIIMTVGRYGFGEIIGRLDLLRYLKLRKPNEPPLPRVQRGVRFRMMLEQLGPTFIKLGQVLSTRPDLLPADIIEELANLQDRVTPQPWETVKKRLPPRVLEVFEKHLLEFNPEPIASASMAQVYSARLPTGEPVAVKLIRPGAEKIIRDDLQILEHLARLIHIHLEEAREWNFEALVAQFRSSIFHELDLQHEGRNADIFRANFADDPTIAVPRIYWDLTSRQLLVMEFIQGRKLSDFLHNDTPAEVRRTLAVNGARAVLRQIFEHGFFQADPHPGNAFVLEGQVICFLDFGMFGRLDPQSLDLLAVTLHAIVKKDVDRLLRAARDMNILDHCPDEPALRLAILDMLEQYHGIPLRQINIAKLLKDIIGLINHHRLRVRPDFIFLLKALGTIEATGRKLDPDFDMISQLEPFVRSLVLKRYSPHWLLESGRFFAEDVFRLAKETPEHLLEILRIVRSGKLKVEMQHTGMDDSLGRLNQMTDKLTLGIILAALIIASSFMAHGGIGPKLFGLPVIGGVGFLIAGVAGLWIIYDILSHRRR